MLPILIGMFVVTAIAGMFAILILLMPFVVATMFVITIVLLFWCISFDVLLLGSIIYFEYRIGCDRIGCHDDNHGDFYVDGGGGGGGDVCYFDYVDFRGSDDVAGAGTSCDCDSLMSMVFAALVMSICNCDCDLFDVVVVIVYLRFCDIDRAGAFFYVFMTSYKVVCIFFSLTKLRLEGFSLSFLYARKCNPGPRIPPASFSLLAKSQLLHLLTKCPLLHFSEIPPRFPQQILNM